MLFGSDIVRHLLSIRREHIRSRNLERAAGGRRRESAEIDRNFHGAVLLAIEDEKDNFALITIVHSRRDDIGNGSSGLRFALLALDLRLKNTAMSMLANNLEGMKDRLAPCRASRFRENHSDHVDQLSLAGHLHPIGVIQERDQGAADDQRVLEIIDFLEQRGCLGR